MAVCSPHNRLINKPPIDSLCWRTLRRIKWGSLGLKFEMKFFLILHLSTSFAVGRRSLAWWIFFNFYYYLFFSYTYSPCPSLLSLSSEKRISTCPELATIVILFKGFSPSLTLYFASSFTSLKLVVCITSLASAINSVLGGAGPWIIYNEIMEIILSLRRVSMSRASLPARALFTHSEQLSNQRGLATAAAKQFQARP